MARLGAHDWIDAGMRLLKRDHMRPTVEALCRELGKTKGSFYHHFQDIEAFGVAILALWADEHTDKIIAKVDRVDDEIELQEKTLDDLAMETDWELERAIRAWGWRDPSARQVVDTVDQKRITYLIRLFTAAGIEETRAKALAQVKYAGLVGATHLFVDPFELRASFDLIF